MEPSAEAIGVRLCRLRSRGHPKLGGETLLDAIATLYDECNKDALQRNDPHVSNFVDKYREAIYDLKQTRVNVADFHPGDLIGRGHFGEVHVIREKHTGDVYAMKTLKKDIMLRHINIAFFEEERDIMAVAKSKWLVKLQYAFQDTTQLYLVMEYCPGGDLAGLLERTGKPLLLKDAVFYVAEILLAMKELHSLGFVHRDIKPDNVFLDRCGHLKLGDFGSAARLSNSNKLKSSVPIGTTEYISPEILMCLENPEFRTPLNVSCDYWSLGIVAYELVTCTTPFKAPENNTIHTYKKIIEHSNKNKCVNIKYPVDVNVFISDEYKTMVKNLLHPVPEKRPTYEDLKRYLVFQDVSWDSISEQVPPFVPILKSQDDTSNFLEVEKQEPVLSSNSFKTKSDFNGKNLPFIGFTYARDIPFLSDSISLFKKTSLKDSTCNSSGESCSNGFLNNSFNGTAINMSNLREMENLLESRKREIESLHKQLAALELKRNFSGDREIQFQKLEVERTQAAKDLADLLCQNKKLQHQLEMEHKGRQVLENKSLELIRSAKDRWKEKMQEQISSLNNVISQYESSIAEKDENVRILETQLGNTKSELDKVVQELDASKKVQRNHKDSLATARRLSRQSIIGIEQISQETNSQIQTLTQNLKKEIEMKSKLDCELKDIMENLKMAENTEAQLRTTLQTEKLTYTKELMLLTNKYDEKCQEVSELRYKVNELEEHISKLKTFEQQYLDEKKDSKTTSSQLNHKISNLEGKIEELNSLLKKWKKISKEKEVQYEVLLNDKINMETLLKNAVASEEKHRERVSALEDMLSKLQMEVDELEDMKQKSFIRSPDFHSTAYQSCIDEEKVRNQEEKIRKLEEELKISQEGIAIVKKDARKAELALWKKEKEFSNIDLDRRIATRELKKAEEKVESLNKDLNEQLSKYDNKQKELEEKLSAKDLENSTMKGTIESLNKTIESFKFDLKKMEKSMDSENKRYDLTHQKTTIEIENLNEKIKHLQNEVSEADEKRKKSEKAAESINAEFKELVMEKCSVKEQKIRLEVMLQERNKDYDALVQNYKILKETCTLLEEQLIDFESVTETLDATNTKLKDEVKSLQEQILNIKVESSKLQKLLDIQKFNAISSDIKMKEHEQILDDNSMNINSLQKQINDLLNHESELTSDINNKHLIITKLEYELKQISDEKQTRQAENIALKEECTRLLTEIANLREENMHVHHDLKEFQENNENLHKMIKEHEEELAAQQFHWQQCELKAESTIAQQIKLIDFLQMKVEELSKRKKTFGDILFGKSSTKENLMPPSTPQTPINKTPSYITDQSRNYIREKQKNKELQEQLANLQSKLKLLETKSEDKVDTILLRNENNGECLKDGFVKIQRCSNLVKVNMKLYSDHLEWNGEKDDTKGQIKLNKNSTRLISDLSTNDYDVILSDSERKFGFKIDTVSQTTCWPSQTVVVICSSLNQKETWLQEIRKLHIPSKKESTLPSTNSRIKGLIQFSRNSMDPNCLLEIEKNLLFIGANNGLFCTSLNANKKLIAISGIKPVTRVRTIPVVDQIIMLYNTGRLVHYSLRQLTAMLKSAALSLIQPSSLPTFRNINMNDPEDLTGDDHCDMFEVSYSKNEKDRIILCASTATKLKLFQYDNVKMSFFSLYSLKTDNIACMRFTPHTIIVASHKFYEIDLKNFKVEEFLDPSDASLSHAVYAHKKNIFPIAIIQTKDISVEKCCEYLLCYSSFGIFVDEFGQRSRHVDVKWSHLPLKITFRKPFIFVSHLSSMEIIHLKDDSFQKSNDFDSDRDTDSISSRCDSNRPARVLIEFDSLRFLGKSMNNSSVYVMAKAHDNTLEILEINGNDAFKKHLGESIETLDTIDDNDSCNNLKVNNGKELDLESIVSGDLSVEVKTDFAAHIRDRARIINSLKRENNKVDLIKNMLSQRNRRSSDSSSGDESDLSLSFNDNNPSTGDTESGETYLSNRSDDTKTQSSDKTTDDIVQEMFVSKKQVRFS